MYEYIKDDKKGPRRISQEETISKKAVEVVVRGMEKKLSNGEDKGTHGNTSKFLP